MSKEDIGLKVKILNRLDIIIDASKQFTKNIFQIKKDWNIETAKIIILELHNTLILLKEIISKLQFNDKINNYKTSIILSLCRNFIEGNDKIMYLLYEFPRSETLKEEHWNYHIENKRLTCLESMGSLSEEWKKLRREVEDRRLKLEDNMKKYYPELDEKSLNILLNQEHLSSKTEVYKKFNVSEYYINSSWKHSSQFVHFTPLSIKQMEFLKHISVYEKEDFMFINLNTVLLFYSMILKSFANIYKYKFDKKQYLEIESYSAILIGRELKINYEKILKESEVSLFLSYVATLYPEIEKFNLFNLTYFLLHNTIYARMNNSLIEINKIKEGSYSIFAKSITGINEIGKVEIKDSQIIKLYK